MDEKQLQKLKVVRELFDNSNAQIQASNEDFEFYSGKQWSDKELKRRRNRPSLVNNVLPTYVNRVINNVKLNPFELSSESTDADVNDFVEGLIRKIEYNSDAKMKYERALEQATIGGVGYLIVRNDYTNEEDLEQTIIIDSPQDPSQVLFDWSADSWENARRAFYYSFIPKEEAEQLYGEDLKSGFQLGIEVPDKYILDGVLYEIKFEEKRKYWLHDGTTTYEKPDVDFLVRASRTVRRRFVEITKIIGTDIVDVSSLDINYLPIIPVLGERVYGQDRKYVGMVNRLRDIQIQLNYISSSETELIATAPKNPWIVADSSIQNHVDTWARAAVETPAFLPYTAVEGIQPPFRENSVANTGHLQASYGARIADLQRISGVFDSQLGQSQGVESGIALQSKNLNAEISTAGYINGLQTAITRLGKVILSMIPIIYDTERDVDIMGPERENIVVTVNPSNIIRDNNVNIYVTAGPSYAIKRAGSRDVLMALTNLVPEDKKSSFVDLFVEQSDILGKSKVIKRLERIMPELNDEVAQPDPEAIQALQVAEQTIQEQQATIETANQVIMNMQQYILGKEKDNDTKLQIEAMKAEVQLAIAQMKEENANLRKVADLETRLQEVQEKTDMDATKILLEEDRKDMEQINKDEAQTLEAVKLVTGHLPPYTADKTL